MSIQIEPTPSRRDAPHARTRSVRSTPHRLLWIGLAGIAARVLGTTAGDIRPTVPDEIHRVATASTIGDAEVEES